MYEQRFGLQRRPFPATPDGSLYYPATGHEEALARLERGLADDEGIVLLTGAPGTGKTLLGLCLTEKLGPNRVCAFVTNSHFPDRAGLLQAILYDLSLPYEEGSEQLLRLRLIDAVLKNRQDGKKTVVILDEAQHLRPDHLEELRLLGNLEASSGKAFQVVLIAQPSFLDNLRRPELASFQQRLALRANLSPLGLEEALDYLMHHLRLAGGVPEQIMDEAGLEVLARGTGGVPRLLNQAAQQALLLADAGELEQVDAEAALEALSLLGLESAREDSEVAEEPSGAEAALVRLAEQTRRPA
jgi:type II secretory pathway predicted ATPase ExeA